MKQLITLGFAAACAWCVLPASAAVAGAPDTPKDVVVTFPDGGLYGYVEFTAPLKTVGGVDLNGNLKFQITANNQTIASGEVYPGVSKSVDVNMAAPGVYEFAVTVSNDMGTSDAGTFRVGAGYSPAEAPQPVASLAADGNVRISWPAVTRALDGSSILGKDVTYRVERYPDGHFVALNTPDLSVVDDNLDGDLHAYRYYVMAIYNSTPGDEMYSNPVVVGSTSAPFFTGFNEQADMDLFTTFDLDGDGHDWEFWRDEVRGSFNQTDRTKTADDWLISPAINLSRTGFHPVSFDVRLQQNMTEYPARVELCYGPAPDPEAMTHVAIPATDVVSSTLQTVSGTAKAEWDGPTYFGIHNITEPDMWYVFVTNLNIEASAESMVPAAPGDLSAKADIDGKLSVDLTFSVPELTLGEQPLDELDRIEIRRDGKTIATFSDVTPGQTISYTDMRPEDMEQQIDEETGLPVDDGYLTQGEHNYSVVAFNKYGQGIESKITLFAGINIPGIPAWAKATEVATEVSDFGFVKIEWEPVTTYIDGTPLNPDNVTYCIYTTVTGQNMLLLNNLKGNSHTFQIMIPDEPQLFFQFIVTAETSYGENPNGIATEYIPIGEPHAAPYEDSFSDLACAYTYVMGGSNTLTYMDNASDAYFEDVKSLDADNGMLYMFGDGIGSNAYLMTGKIDLRGLTSPMLTFYVFNMVGDYPNDNTVEVFLDGGDGEWKSAGIWKLSDFGDEDWYRIAVPLDDYKNGTVRARLVGTVQTYQYIHFDNLQVRDRRNHDLALTSLSVPERVKCGNDCPIVLSYANFGLNNAGEFSIEVLQDGKQVAEKSFASLPTDGRGELTIPVRHNAVTPESVSYDVRLNYAPDQVQSNNLFETFEVKTIESLYPAVTDLAANYGDDPTELTLVWSAPELTGDINEDTVENFENAASWATELDGWTFIDNDQQFIYGFEPWIVLPDYAPKAETRQSWWICDASYQPMIEHYSDPRFYKAHSGDKYMISMAVTNGDPDYESERSDDWAISPVLPGVAQTVSLWAKSMLEDCTESFEFLYSTSDKEIKSFESVQTIRNVGWDWTQYFFDIPEGAKYFAIRCISRDQYVLMIDDINFTPAGTASDLKVSGYNIYRDRQPLNEEPVKSCRFSDTRSDAAVMPTYNVTAVYEGRGESSLSNDAKPEFSGVDAVLDGVTVSASQGRLNIAGAEGCMIRVFSADGTAVASEVGMNSNTISLTQGIYLVQIEGRSWKVFVR